MFDGRDPIYLQIADRIRAEIVSGALLEGEQVMSTTQYATTFRINPATAGKAFAELVDEGVLHKRRGVGMFVSAGARNRLLEGRREHFLSEVVASVAADARTLGVPMDEVVARLRLLDAAPVPAGTDAAGTTAAGTTAIQGER